MSRRVDVIIPALNEEGAIGQVVRSIPRPPVRAVWVVDNGSTDRTAEVAEAAGAQVVSEPRRGYGSACLAGLAAAKDAAEVFVFLDGDGSDDPALIPALLQKIDEGADLVVGSRSLGAVQTLSAQQRVGNAVAALWLRKRFGLAASDLGPFRAIRSDALQRLQMADRDYGWTVEMQIKAARAGLRYAEVQVPVRPRLAGESKVSGTLRGVVGASGKILGLLLRHDVEPSLRKAYRSFRPRASTHSKAQ